MSYPKAHLPARLASAHHGRDRQRSVAAWMPPLVAYREELRRAVTAIDERRRRVWMH